MVAVLAGPRDAGARRPSETKYEDVERILKHKPDATPADLAAAGADIDSVLTDMVSTRKLNPELRLRAVRALGGYPGSRARAVLTTLTTTPDEATDVRVAAMETLAKTFGQSVLSDIKPYVKDPDPALRMAAARALGAIGGREARGLLAHALEHEDVLEVRLIIDEALARIR
jgi:HEAT repeat protein